MTLSRTRARRNGHGGELDYIPFDPFADANARPVPGHGSAGNNSLVPNFPQKFDSGKPPRGGVLSVPSRGTAVSLTQTLQAPDFSIPDPTHIADAHHYAEILSVQGLVNQLSILALSRAPTKRNFLIIRNSTASGVGAPNLYVDFSKQATLQSPIQITPGGYALFDAVVPQNDVYLIADAANCTFSIAFANVGY